MRDVMVAEPVFVVHMEDPGGSGRAACNGMLFERTSGVARRGDTLWMCTGCFYLGRHQGAAARLASAVRALFIPAEYSRESADVGLSYQDGWDDAVERVLALLKEAGR